MSTFGSFGAPKPAGTNVFGSFGQQNTTAQAQPSTNLFGASTFGQPQQQTQQQQQPQQQNQPSSGVGAFGQPQQQQQPAQNAFGTTSLFGNTNTNQIQPVQQPSLFPGFTSNTNTTTTGQPASTSQPQPATNLFGSTTTQMQQPNSGTGTGLGLFGSTTAAPAQTQTSTGAGTGLGLFGASSNTGANTTAGTGGPTLGGFGASTLGQQSQQSMQPQQPSGPLFTKTTKFNDLPDEVKKKLESIDSFIQGRVQISTELKQNRLDEEPVKGAEQIRSVHKDLVIAINNLRTDIASMRELRAKMDQSVQDTIIATRIIDANRNPGQPQGSVYLKNYANFPLEFFARISDQLRERLTWISNTLEQIERKLASEVNHVSITPQAISATLQAQHSSFIALANKTATLDAELQKIKTTYRQLWRAKTGSARDPFNEQDRSSGTTSEFGLEGLKIGV